MQTPQDPMAFVKVNQRQWAAVRGVPFDKDGYCYTIEDNLFGGLSAAAKADFTKGKGAELGSETERGKIRALHSSSALACNWFDFWRGRDMKPRTEGLGLSSPLRELVGLEQQVETGVRGGKPNLDALFRCEDGTRVAVESKFCEPYSPSKGKTALADAYVPERNGVEQTLWTNVGLPGCQRVAASLRSGRHDFKRSTWRSFSSTCSVWGKQVVSGCCTTSGTTLVDR